MRRRTIQYEDDGAGDINLTPMMDVVFIMLIFFIVTASFVKESGIEVNQPSANTSTLQKHATILVAIDANNQVWINRRQVEIGALRANVERLHLDNPLGTLVIQADKQSSNGKLVDVMDEIRQAGVEKIAIAASKE